MSQQETMGMEQRLARVEAELAATRTQLQALEQQQSRQQRQTIRMRRLCGALGVCVAVTAIGFLQVPRGEAKGTSKPSAGNAKGLTVRGPLIVLDEAGRTVMRVQSRSEKYSRGMLIFNEQGNIVVNAQVSQKGHGSLIARNGLADEWAGPGSGFIFDNDGNPILGMKGKDDKQFLNVTTKGLQLSQGDAVAINLGFGEQGGLLNLCDNAGNTMVEAGILPTNRGIVRTYPMSGHVPVPLPDFIMGAKSQ